MCTKNYILLNRNLLINDLWNSEPFTRGQAWVDLLLNTNWKDCMALVKGVSIPVKRGQACRSVKQLAIRWKWSEGKVKRYLDLLVSLDQISYETWGKNGAVNGAVKTGITTLITIKNYNTYQLDGAANGAQTERKQSGDGAQTETYKKDKKEEEGKEETTTPLDVDRTGRTDTELIFIDMFKEREGRLRRLFPQHKFEVVMEGCLAHWRTRPPPMDPYKEAYGWFKMEQTSQPATFHPSKPKVQRGLSDDFEETFCRADQET